jgi:hypothetical protein
MFRIVQIGQLWLFADFHLITMETLYEEDVFWKSQQIRLIKEENVLKSKA